MEQNFQTSFIPKKPIIKERVASSHHVGFLTVVSLFIFFSMILGSGGLYFYKGILQKDVEKKKSDLDLAKNRFEISKITQLQDLDKRLRASNEVLSKHVAISPIFKALQDITEKTVRFKNFSYDLSEDRGKKITVKMSGIALGYRSIAQQTELFNKNKNLIDPIFSNLTLDEKGNVSFDLEFSVDPTFVDYKQTLKVEEGNILDNVLPGTEMN